MDADSSPIYPLPEACTADTSYCLAEIRRLDRERYWTLLFIDPNRRWRLAALYAFHLEIARTREVVTETLLGEMRLQWWRDTIDGIYEGNIRQHQVVRLLAAAVSDSDIAASDLIALVDARATDLETTPFADMAAFTAYATNTGGALQRLACRLVCESPGPTAADLAAREIGTAYAVMGLLRRSAFDAASRRLLLPESSLRAENISADAFFRGQVDAGLQKIVAEIAEAAEQHLQRGQKTILTLPRKFRRNYLIGALARRHLGRLRRAKYNLFQPEFARTAQNPLPDLLALCLAALR